MAVAVSTEEAHLSLPKGLSEWWSEETEYVFQRIERWAAYARGYNRLRSQRLSRGRMTMQEEQEPRWSISSNKIVIEDPTWSPRFHNLKRSHRRKSRTDENCRINCCGTFNYQSNSNLDSTCLETYRYDHSIYFKTIGDIKSSKKDASASKSETDDASWMSDEQFEWEAKTAPGFFDDHRFYDDNEVDFNNENSNGVWFDASNFEMNFCESEDKSEREAVDSVVHSVWPIVDLKNMSLDVSNDNKTDGFDNNFETPDGGSFAIARDTEVIDNDSNNNDCGNCNEVSSDTTQKMIQLQINELANNQTRPNASSPGPMKNNHEGIARILSFRKSKRSPRKVRQPPVFGDNNVMWPGVLLNYTQNIDPANSPHHRYAVHVK